jgi:hypothetical protein
MCDLLLLLTYKSACWTFMLYKVTICQVMHFVIEIMLISPFSQLIKFFLHFQEFTLQLNWVLYFLLRCGGLICLWLILNRSE